MYIINMGIEYDSHDITYFNVINKLFDLLNCLILIHLKLFTVKFYFLL